MPNGKGWLDCIDCIYQKKDIKIKKNNCKKHNVILPNPELGHMFCSYFSPKSDSKVVLNNSIVKDEDKYYYYVYKPGSKFFDSEFNKKILISNNKLYAYLYPTPEKIEVINEFKE